MHSTSVAQLVVGVDAPVIVEAEGLPDIVTRSTVAPARVPHRIRALGERVLICYFDPATAAPRLGEMVCRHGPFGIGHPRERSLIEAGAVHALDIDAVLSLARLPVGDIDPRITKVASMIRADPARRHRAVASAAELGLSRSHFLRLFAEQTATSYRRYIQWARILHAADAIADGADFTRAASEAGFASPSHFSDVFRDMFGITPRALFTSGVRFG